MPGPRFWETSVRAKALVTAIIGLLAAFVFSHPVLAQVAPALPAPTQPGAPGGALTRALGDVSGNGAPLSLSLQILILMSLLTVLPSLILMMTSFTRIIIVLSLLRQALGLAQTPPNQVLVGLALFLSLFVMRPTIDAVTQQAYTPYGAGQITIEEAIGRSGKIFHTFMAKQTRESDLRMFTGLADAPDYQNIDEVPFTILLPAFVTSELKTAFQIGFMIFLPFLIIDLVVASTLMSLGMMMLSPTIISMPFKLLLFVMVDGWALTMGSLAGSFAT
ncbi:MAG: flagellar type III secretion system pore protein FliP [Sphingobium sp.]|nr:flagellar type III secretion system pore protein FliP [Sphingobium sp.]MCP5400693.1 flagellar type III secretion system pore protein FliP [Sphingomonas sp.]